MSLDLHFPTPPFRVDRLTIDVSSEELASYLARVRLWRAAVLEFIGLPNTQGMPGTEGLTGRARKALETFLASQWTEPMTAYAIQCPYNITSFPLSATGVGVNPTPESVLEVLRWRAGVVDYLDDVWDVIGGDPFLNMDECAALGLFLEPVSKEQRCCFCLTELTSEQLDSDRHVCLLSGHVNAKLPQTPPAFARWKKEARVQ